MAPAAALQPCSASAVTASSVSTDAFASACVRRVASLVASHVQCSQRSGKQRNPLNRLYSIMHGKKRATEHNTVSSFQPLSGTATRHARRVPWKRSISG